MLALCEEVRKHGYLGAGRVHRSKPFGLLGDQCQGVVRNGRWTCALSNSSMPDVPAAI